MSSNKQPVGSAVVFSRGGVRSVCRAAIPAAVRDHLGAKVGDKLIFEPGCDRAVTLAALNGPYLVVWLERATEQPAQAETVDNVALPVAIESIEEAVRRRLSEQHEGDLG